MVLGDRTTSLYCAASGDFRSGALRCDVKAWYRTMVAGGVLNDALDHKQAIIKEKIEELLAKHENDIFIECRLLSMYDNILKRTESNSASVRKTNTHDENGDNRVIGDANLNATDNTKGDEDATLQKSVSDSHFRPDTRVEVTHVANADDRKVSDKYYFINDVVNPGGRKPTETSSKSNEVNSGLDANDDVTKDPEAIYGESDETATTVTAAADTISTSNEEEDETEVGNMDGIDVDEVNMNVVPHDLSDQASSTTQSAVDSAKAGRTNDSQRNNLLESSTDYTFHSIVLRLSVKQRLITPTTQPVNTASLSIDTVGLQHVGEFDELLKTVGGHRKPINTTSKSGKVSYANRTSVFQYYLRIFTGMCDAHTLGVKQWAVAARTGNSTTNVSLGESDNLSKSESSSAQNEQAAVANNKHRDAATTRQENTNILVSEKADTVMFVDKTAEMTPFDKDESVDSEVVIRSLEEKFDEQARDSSPVNTGPTASHLGMSLSNDNNEAVFNTRQQEYHRKIDTLEMQILRLENRLLMDTLSKHNNTAIVARLENQLLKLENELLRMKHDFVAIHKENEQLKQNQYTQANDISLFNKRRGSDSQHAIAVDNNTVLSQMISVHSDKIRELTASLKEQMQRIRDVEEQSEKLRQQNAQLVNMMAKQSALISQIEDRLETSTLKQNEQNKLMLDKLERGTMGSINHDLTEDTSAVTRNNLQRSESANSEVPCEDSSIDQQVNSDDFVARGHDKGKSNDVRVRVEIGNADTTNINSNESAEINPDAVGMLAGRHEPDHPSLRRNDAEGVDYLTGARETPVDKLLKKDFAVNNYFENGSEPSTVSGYKTRIADSCTGNCRQHRESEESVSERELVSGDNVEEENLVSSDQPSENESENYQQATVGNAEIGEEGADVSDADVSSDLFILNTLLDLESMADDSNGLTTEETYLRHNLQRPLDREQVYTYQTEQEVMARQQAGQEQKTGQTQGNEQARETGQTKGTEQTRETGQTKGTEQTRETGQTHGTEQTRETGQTKGTEQTRETGQTKGTEQIRETGQTKGTEQARETGQTKGTEQTRETGQTHGTEHTRETGQTQGAEQTRETGQTKGTEQTRETGQTQGTEQTRETGQTQGTEQARETGQTKGTEQTRETGQTQGAEQARETGQPKVTEQTRETGQTHGTEQTRGTGQTKGTEQTREIGQTKGTEQTRETGRTIGTEQTREIGQTKETEQTRETGQTKGTEQTRETGQAKGTEQTRETGQTQGTEQTRETGQTKGTEQTRETGQTKGTEQIRETGQTKGTEQARETGQTKGTEQTRETGQTHGTEHTRETGQTQGAEQTRETGQTKVTEQTRETGQTKGTEQTRETGQPKVTEQTRETGQTHGTEQTRETGQTKVTEQTRETGQTKGTEQTRETGRTIGTEQTREIGQTKETEQTRETGQTKGTEQTREIGQTKGTEQTRETGRTIGTEQTREIGQTKETEQTRETGQTKGTEQTREIGQTKETEQTRETGQTKGTEQTRETGQTKVTEQTRETGQTKGTEQTRETGQTKGTEQTREIGQTKGTEQTRGTGQTKGTEQTRETGQTKVTEQTRIQQSQAKDQKVEQKQSAKQQRQQQKQQQPPPSQKQQPSETKVDKGQVPTKDTQHATPRRQKNVKENKAGANGELLYNAL